jgi:hypothetical protein
MFNTVNLGYYVIVVWFIYFQKLLNGVVLQSFDYEREWWRLFQYARIKLDIYVFHCHWVDTSSSGLLLPLGARMMCFWNNFYQSRLQDSQIQLSLLKK